MAFVEEAAIVYGELGLPPMAGRILGWLFVCEPMAQTQAELADVLRASKGSISTMVRVLLRIGFIRRVSLPGDRRERVQLREPKPGEMREEQARRFIRMRELADHGIRALGGEASPRAARLVHLRDLHAFLERELPRLFERFHREMERKLRRGGHGGQGR